ncbi:hypothetical protein SAMN02787142_4321 [Burkholderia sp. WP9]|uniref:hypothetical protein n=1 Tax=Burkholderia sp. WP9 TaxID=1500263 RepID=UPI000897D25E|nr:hypothetical protein [Burkholderia sp. WP9]SEE00575.1 hypothetical protein SAMN02787142_4321 [Burkholderia sp. WP9]
MFKRNEIALSADDVAAMLDHAAESFGKLAALNAAIAELAAQPKLARDLARTAHELAEGLAEGFGDFRREYDAAHAASSEQGAAAV